MRLISIEQSPRDRLRIYGEFELNDIKESYNEVIIDNRCAGQMMLYGSPGKMCFEFWYDAIDPYKDANKIEITLYKTGEVIIELEWERYVSIPMNLIHNCYYKVIHTKLKMYPNSQHEPWCRQY